MEDLCLTYTVCFVVGICPSSTFSATAAKLSQSIIVLQITPWSTCKKLSKNSLQGISLQKNLFAKESLCKRISLQKNLFTSSSKKYLRKKYLRKKFLQKKYLGKKSLQNWIVFKPESSSNLNCLWCKPELSLMQNWIIWWEFPKYKRKNRNKHPSWFLEHFEQNGHIVKTKASAGSNRE